MKTTSGHITNILYKHLTGEILSAAEKADLDQWVSSFAANQRVFEELREVKNLENYLQNIYNDEKTNNALKLFEARHSFMSLTETGKASNNPGPSFPKPNSGPSKSSETNQSKPSETNPSKSSETNPSKSSETTQSLSVETNQSKSSETTQSLSIETNPSRSSSVLTTTQGDAGEPGSIFILPGRRRTWFRYAAAAVLVLIGAATAFFISMDRHGARSKRTLAAAPNILPGSQRAVLTLADGRTIVLDSASNGRLADQGGVQVLKQGDGRIVYDGIASTGTEMINTMRTPRGGQYRLTLPDGTDVWLNAVSSITYPATFTGKKRAVTVSGEVYMEVAQNSKKPFIVNVDGQSSIEVLGTSFNVNSYADHESIKTTLVDGKIRVANLVRTAATKSDGRNAPAARRLSATHLNPKTALSVILNPGQQAVIERKPDSPPLIRPVNVEQVLAWKNGLFDIEGLSLQEFAWQLERWYDIRVIYEGPIREMIFEGKLSRDVKLSAVLNWFSELGITNRLEDRTLILKTGN